MGSGGGGVSIAPVTDFIGSAFSSQNLGRTALAVGSLGVSEGVNSAIIDPLTRAPKRQAESQAQSDAAKQAQLVDAANEQMAKSDVADQRNRVRAAQRAAAGGAGLGRGGTILTSPLGTVSTAGTTTGGKTLLGA